MCIAALASLQVIASLTGFGRMSATSHQASSIRRSKRQVPLEDPYKYLVSLRTWVNPFVPVRAVASSRTGCDRQAYFSEREHLTAVWARGFAKTASAVRANYSAAVASRRPAAVAAAATRVPAVALVEVFHPWLAYLSKFNFKNFALRGDGSSRCPGPRWNRRCFRPTGHNKECHFSLSNECLH